MSEIYRGGCGCCPKTQDELPLDTVLYNGFGGYTITKNGEHYFSEDPGEDKEYEDCRTLATFEDEILAEPKADWRVELYLPLRGATWQRQGHKWVLIETNQGFA